MGIGRAFNTVVEFGCSFVLFIFFTLHSALKTHWTYGYHTGTLDLTLSEFGFIGLKFHQTSILNTVISFFFFFHQLGPSGPKWSVSHDVNMSVRPSVRPSF